MIKEFKTVITELKAIVKSIDFNKFDDINDVSPQKRKNRQIKKLQDKLEEKLNLKISYLEWTKEKKISENARDKIDLFGHNATSSVFIEIDAHRADQIAKKFTSRLAFMINSMDDGVSCLYVIVIYPGTAKMNINEAKKYIDYCKYIGERLGITVVDYHTSDLDEKWGDSNG